MSKGSRQKSENKRLPPSAGKVSSSGTVTVWFVPVLTRGKLHIEALSHNFPGETEDGAAEMVAKVRTALNIRFQGAEPPTKLFTDRGNGFYNSGSGAITSGYRDALRAHMSRRRKCCFLLFSRHKHPRSLVCSLTYRTPSAQPFSRSATGQRSKR